MKAPTDIKPPVVKGIEPERVRALNAGTIRKGQFVLYWMQQSQRAEENPALEYAIGLANLCRLPLVVVFGLTSTFPEATARAYAFMLEGLIETREAIHERGAGFVLRVGDPPEVALSVAGAGAAAIVCDRGYLRIQRQWRAAVAEQFDGAVYEVEGDVVVPVETASDHDEYAARTLRPKLLRLRDRFLKKHPRITLICAGRAPKLPGNEPADADEAMRLIRADQSVAPVPNFRGGLKEARARLRRFLKNALPHYGEGRGDAGGFFASRLSAYLHFGQISAIEIANAVKEASAPREAKEAFLEQLIVRRELSMNFVWFNEAYDRWEGLPKWARATLEAHAKDARKYAYSVEEWDEGRTHDAIWNAVQCRLREEGYLPNVQRMYWGKKLLEWSESPQDAFALALRLNNRYELDGRDPNGFTGVAWCFGKHDRPWPERPIYGTVRAMGSRRLKELSLS